MSAEIIKFPERDEQDLLPLAIQLAIEQARLNGYSTFYFEGAKIDVSWPKEVA